MRRRHSPHAVSAWRTCHMETRRHCRQGRTSACPCDLGVDRSPVPIGPIVASEGNGGRLGNYADPTAARLAGRCALLIGNDPDRKRDRHMPTRFSATSAAVHLARSTTPDCHSTSTGAPSDLRDTGLIGDVRHWSPPSIPRISGRRKLDTPDAICASQSPLSLWF